MTLVDPQPRVLPPGVDAAAFTAAIEAFRTAIGGEHVHVDDDHVRAYDDRFPVTEGDDFTPSAVLFPGSTEDVQAIVRIANEHLIPLHSFSTGMNLGYGGSAPRVKGTVLLHLGKRMNQVLEIDERLAYAVVEPGVDYKSLYEAVEASGAQLMIDPTELDWGSPLGNIMEHGAGYTPYGDHAMWRCGMEVVLPDGSVMRTGQGALPGSKAWHIYAGTLGPSVEGLFEQSNFGICTRMGIQLMPKPPETLSFVISFERPEDLAAIMDITLPLRIGMAPLQNPPIVRNVTFDAACVSKREDWTDDPGPLQPETYARMMRELDLGYWNLYGTCYGPRHQIDELLGIIQDAYLQIPGARFDTLETVEAGSRRAELLGVRHELSTGVPNRHSSAVFDWFPNAGHFFYAPVCEPSGVEAEAQFSDTKRISDEHGIDYLAQFIIGLREMHHICLPLYDTSDADSRERTLTMTRNLIDAAAAQGFGVYRAHNVLADQIAATYSFGDHAQRRFAEAIKDALDPNGILNPGKAGIWPKRLRDQGLELR